MRNRNKLQKSASDPMAIATMNGTNAITRMGDEAVV